MDGFRFKHSRRHCHKGQKFSFRGEKEGGNRLRPIDAFYNVGLEKSQQLANYWADLGEPFSSPSLGERGTEGPGVVAYRKRFEKK